MLRRGLIVTTLGITLSLAGASLAGVIPAFAQETTDNVPATQADEQRADSEAERDARYEELLARFTANLGLADPDLVETAFRETLKEVVDDRVAAGDLEADQAEALKTRIDESERPFLIAAILGARHAIKDRHQFRPLDGDRPLFPGDGERQERERRGDGNRPETDDQTETLPASD